MDSFVVGETATVVVALSAGNGPASSVAVTARTPDCTIVELTATAGSEADSYTFDVPVTAAGQWWWEIVGADGDTEQGTFLAVPRVAEPPPP